MHYDKNMFPTTAQGLAVRWSFTPKNGVQLDAMHLTVPCDDRGPTTGADVGSVVVVVVAMMVVVFLLILDRLIFI